MDAITHTDNTQGRTYLHSIVPSGSGKRVIEELAKKLGYNTDDPRKVGKWNDDENKFVCTEKSSGWFHLSHDKHVFRIDIPEHREPIHGLTWLVKNQRKIAKLEQMADNLSELQDVLDKNDKLDVAFVRDMRHRLEMLNNMKSTAEKIPRLYEMFEVMSKPAQKGEHIFARNSKGEPEFPRFIVTVGNKIIEFEAERRFTDACPRQDFWLPFQWIIEYTIRNRDKIIFTD